MSFYEIVSQVRPRERQYFRAHRCLEVGGSIYRHNHTEKPLQEHGVRGKRCHTACILTSVDKEGRAAGKCMTG